MLGFHVRRLGPLLAILIVGSLAQAQHHSNGYHRSHGHSVRPHSVAPRQHSRHSSPVQQGGYRGGLTIAPGTDMSYHAVPYYGFGYALDPYRGGSFRAPDLHDDPFFRAQHKFDSHFPGRYRSGSRLQFRHSGR